MLFASVILGFVVTLITFQGLEDFGYGLSAIVAFCVMVFAICDAKVGFAGRQRVLICVTIDIGMYDVIGVISGNALARLGFFNRLV